MKSKQTPLMKQYGQIKDKYPDSILLFRMGDFFETFFEDAVTTSKVCGITLTKRNNGAAGDCPLAGFPHHQLDAYLPKLVKAGHRVAVCDQLEDPKLARGIVKRGVTEVVTPGVALYDKLLDTNRNNYLASLYAKKIKNQNIIGLACLDVSTGEFFCSEFLTSGLNDILLNLNPSEIIISKSQKNEILPIISKLPYEPVITKLEEWIFDEEFTREALLGHFKTQSLKGFGIEQLDTAVLSAGAILHYVNETQFGKLEHIKNISVFNATDYMILDFSTMRNLEITQSYSGSKEGSLISILDKTCTAMGSRLLIKWVTRPLIKLEPIHTRLSIVSAFVKNQGVLQILRQELKQIGDLERMLSKIASGKSNPRDLISLKQSLEIIPTIKALLSELDVKEVKSVSNKLIELDEVVDIIRKALKEEPSTVIGSGNIFNPGYSEELDSYVDAKYSGKNWISKYQSEEREKTGISKLKVGFNNVFGYYLEITKAHKQHAPDYYERKQTLTNSERYTTPELKEIEDKILNAEEKISILESSLFETLKNQIFEFIEPIQRNSILISNIDCLQSFAECSIEYNYCKPEINETNEISIVEGRHPVVERLINIGESFAPNDTNMNNEEQLIHILTGPNMSGKSCYLRQVGLILLLGQIGCFVPANTAKFGIVDRIFTRVGAQDNISLGESTFLVEMQEVANIINNASERSLILLDEVGRGTATFDGISLAWAITEYLHNTLQAKTLFATHYHELNDMASKYEKIYNYRVEVLEAGDTIIFTHKVLSGATDHSFGIHVAQMAGLPDEVTDRADIIMRAFEHDSSSVSTNTAQTKKISTDTIKPNKSKHIPEQMSIFEFRDDVLREQIINLDLNNLSPIEAFNILDELQKKAKKGKR